MNICACGCQQPCKKRFVHGHYGKWLKKQRESPTPNDDIAVVLYGPRPTFDPVNYGVVPDGPQPPPPHPLPFDHGKYRIAEEPVGTNPFLPWQEARCLECLEVMWRKNEKADLCETCSYMIVTELSEKRVAKENRTRIPWNPFE